MFKAFSGLLSPNSKNNAKNNSKNPTDGEVSVRSPEEIADLEKSIHVGPVTLVLVHADWCGPCQMYKPIWKELENVPGRKAKMAMIHHDMVEHSQMLKNANIPGYPSVLKVYPNGKIEEYKGTNSMPNIRDKDAMIKELLTPNHAYAVSQNTKRNIGNILPPVMKGGSLYAALTLALKQAGPSAVLLAASQALPPKRTGPNSARRTRKAKGGRRLSKSNARKSRKN